jgi:hypothetical protein
VAQLVPGRPKEKGGNGEREYQKFRLREADSQRRTRGRGRGRGQGSRKRLSVDMLMRKLFLPGFLFCLGHEFDFILINSFASFDVFGIRMLESFSVPCVRISTHRKCARPVIEVFAWIVNLCGCLLIPMKTNNRIA